MISVGAYHEYTGVFNATGFLYKFTGLATTFQIIHGIPWCTHDIPQCNKHPLVYS